MPESPYNLPRGQSAAARYGLRHQDQPDVAGSEDGAERIKLVLIGDGSVGKTSLLVSYTTNGYPTEYIPTAFDKYTVSVDVDNQPLRVQLFDTAGQDDFDSLRPLCYSETDAFLLTFSVVSPSSFRNIRSKWLPELQAHMKSSLCPVILVGTQCDLRDDVSVLVDLAKYNEHPVTESEIKELMKSVGAVDYVECSALTQRNLKKVFDTAIVAVLRRRTQCHEVDTPTVTCNDLLKRTASRTKKEGQKILPKRRSWKKYLCIF